MQDRKMQDRNLTDRNLTNNNIEQTPYRIIYGLPTYSEKQPYSSMNKKDGYRQQNVRQRQKKPRAEDM